jgi:hypothetical protein|eukprot:COSAG03_NODE_7365_length_928_cov_0.980700_1_plen_98_part_00
MDKPRGIEFLRDCSPLPQLGVLLLCGTALAAVLAALLYYFKHSGEDKHSTETSGSTSELEDSVDLEQRSLLAADVPAKAGSSSGSASEHEQSVELEH